MHGGAPIGVRRRREVDLVLSVCRCTGGRPAVPIGRQYGAGFEPGCRRRHKRLGTAAAGRRPTGHDDGGCGGEADRALVLPAPVRSAFQSDRQHDEAGDRLGRGQAFHRAQRSGLARHSDRCVRLPRRQHQHPGRFDHRTAVREELPVAGDGPNRRRAAGRRRVDARAQAARDALGARPRQNAVQGRDPHPVPEPGVFRQRRIRRAGCGADLLRRQCVGPELAAGRAVGGTGEVHEHLRPVHQSPGRDGTAKRGVGHHDRESACGGRRTACRQGRAVGDAGPAEPAAGRMRRRRGPRLLL